MYVRRAPDGQIVAVSKVSDPEFTEEVKDNSQELLGFFQQVRMAQQQSLQESDLHLVRVLEDLINLLIERNLIRFTDLPSAAQSKLLTRRALREGVDLLDSEEDIPL